MRLDRLTTKTREALVAAQQNAADRGNPEVYPEHLLLDLLAQAGGLAPAILGKAGADLQGLIRALGAVLDRMPKVAGGAEPGISSRLRDVLTPPPSTSFSLRTATASSRRRSKRKGSIARNCCKPCKRCAEASG